MSNAQDADQPKLSSYLGLAAFLVVVLGMGWFIGFSTGPDEWYRQLAKPPFNPPGWVFAPVWTVLYVLIAIAGWRTYRQPGTRAAMVLWCVQMVLNWAWSPIWFSLHALWLALAVILALLITIIAFIARTWHSDRPSALLFLPYLAWVSFASLLNLSIAVLN